MTRPKRIILSLTLFVLGVGVLIALGLLVLYHHPASVKALAETWLSSRFEARVTIGELSYGLAPINLNATDIGIHKRDSGRELDARIAGVEIRCRLEGPFGRRTLAVERLAISGLVVRAEDGAPWEKLTSAPEPPSALSRLAGRASTVMFFRDLRLEQVALTDAELYWDTGEIRLALRRVEALTAPGGIEVVGSARIDWPVTSTVLEVDRFSVLFNPVWSAERNGLSGRLDLPDVRYTGPQATAAATRAEASFELELSPDRITVAAGQAGCELFRLSIDGNPEIRLDAPRVSLSADYKRSERLLVLKRGEAAADELAGGALRIKQLEVDAVAEGVFPVVSVSQAEIRTPAATLSVEGNIYLIKDFALRLKNASFDADRATVSIPEISLTSDLLRNLKGSIAGDTNHVTIDVAGSGTGVVEAAGRYDLLPQGWRFNAADRFQAKAVWRPEGESTLSTTIDLTQARFSNPAENFVGEGLSLRAEIGLRTDRRGNAVAATAAARTTAGEVLWEGIYLDLGGGPVVVSSEFHYTRDKRRLQIKGATLEVGTLLTVGAHASMDLKAREPSYDLTLHMPAAPLAPMYSAVVAEPLQYRNPMLSGLRVGGQLSVDLNVTAQGERRTTRGRVNWNSGSLSTPDEEVRLEGIDLNLPLWHQSGSPNRGAATMSGELTVRRISLPALPAQELSLPLSAGPDQLTVGPGIRVRFPTGEVRFDPIICRDLFSSRPKAKTRITVDRVHVGHFLKGIWSTPVAAVLSGSLGEIDFDGRDLRSRGRLALDIFGGKIMVDNPGVSGMLSAAPAIGADCLIEGLDLSELTRDTSFGRIQGVFSGFVNHLEIVNFQPQRFVLQLETVRRKGVPQRINVAAVESIARIGGGQSPFVGLAGHVGSFFNEFVYAKIGVRAVLENDQFRINGTVKEGGVEYLVKKGGVPGVDVVNLNPTNQISFKDMVKRVQRVSESESGPVVR